MKRLFLVLFLGSTLGTPASFASLGEMKMSQMEPRATYCEHGGLKTFSKKKKSVRKRRQASGSNSKSGRAS